MDSYIAELRNELKRLCQRHDELDSKHEELTKKMKAMNKEDDSVCCEINSIADDIEAIRKILDKRGINTTVEGTKYYFGDIDYD